MTSLYSFAFALPAAAAPSVSSHGPVLAFASTATFLALFQLLLGADTLVVGFAFAGFLVTLTPLAVFGWRNVTALLCLLVGIRYFLTAFIWKSIVFEPLDLGLYAPLESFRVAFVGAVMTTLAVFGAHALWRRGPLFEVPANKVNLQTVALAGLILYFIFLCIRLVFGEIPGSVIALPAMGLPLLVISLIGLNAITSDGRRILSPALVAIIAVAVVHSIAANSRTGTAVVAFSFLAAIYAFRIRPSFWMVLPAAFAGWLFFYGISPAILEVRGMRDDAGFGEMLATTFDRVIARLFYGEANLIEEFDPSYFLQYVRDSTGFLSRFVNIQQMDILIALTSMQGGIGYDRFWIELRESLPQQLIGEKVTLLETDYAFWYYGARFHDSHLEVTLFGSAFSYDGYSSLVIFSFLIPFLYFFLFRMYAQSVDRSIVGAYVLVNYFHTISAGAVSFWPLYRVIPFEILILYVIALAARYRAKTAGP